jgi:hypothetical protein
MAVRDLASICGFSDEAYFVGVGRYWLEQSGKLLVLAAAPEISFPPVNVLSDIMPPLAEHVSAHWQCSAIYPAVPRCSQTDARYKIAF